MLKGHFVACRSGNLFVCQYGQQQGKQAVLLLPSLFEEMNLSRAVATKQAFYFADNGLPVYALDYFGTGDSEGDISGCSAQLWLNDIEDVVSWLSEQGVEELIIWGIRAGGLLAMNALPQLVKKVKINGLLFWKPVIKGKLFMSQFLRLKQANNMIQGAAKINWREKIRDGEPVEIAGYRVTDTLFSSLEQLELNVSSEQNIHINWFELATRAVSPAVNNALNECPKENYQVCSFEGVSFWQIPEVFAQEQLHAPTFDSVRPLL